MTTQQGVAPDRALTIPTASLTLAEIQGRVDTFLLDALEVVPAPELYVYLKQLEAAIDIARKVLAARATQEVGERFAGVTQGTVLGHKVQLTSRSKWVYAQAHADMKEQHKLELEAEEARQRAAGLARQEPGGTELRITITKER